MSLSAVRGSRMPALALAAFVALLTRQPAVAQAPTGLGAGAQDPPAATAPAPIAAAPAPAPVATAARVDDQITVTATRSPRAVKDTPGIVDVIGAKDIDQEMMRNTADLVKFAPGVYVDNDPTRLGPNGFNIRGIGGNRVLTRIDGIETGQSFSFGPLAAPQFSVDLDALEKVEIVRSAGSALYGSDALGGVVSLITKDPADYLGTGTGSHVEGRAGYTGRDKEWLEDGAAAFGGQRWQGSLFAARSDAHETENKGTNDSLDSDRTAPNPQDLGLTTFLGKLVFEPSESSLLKLTGETRRGDTATQVYSQFGFTPLGPGVSEDVSRFAAQDDERRNRVSLDGSVIAGTALWSAVDWRLYYREDDTAQHTTQNETTLGEDGDPSVPSNILRRGLLTFDEKGFGGEVKAQKDLSRGTDSQLLTYGVSYTRDRFDQLRDSNDQDLTTGAQNVYLGPFVYPTKYFPTSNVSQFGAYVQDELSLAGGRLKLVPGLRYDRYSVAPNQHDAIYLGGNAGILPPAKVDDSAVSPRLGAVLQMNDWLTGFAQYARGFRAPAFDAVNSGFTNFASGYTTLPNPDLEPESSGNTEFGLRGTWRHAHASVAYFYNRYTDFIDFVALGVDPTSGLLEFQNVNDQHATIQGLEVSGDLRFADAWTVRASAAAIKGRNDSADLPLNSVAPLSGVLGLRYAPAGSIWGGELIASLVASKRNADVDKSEVDQFVPPGYQDVDCTFFVDLRLGITLNLGVFNLFDQKIWSWPNVVGLDASSPVLDRYTNSGRSFAVSLRLSR
jgi:hemoglobin/transferrin/lactoferrin receptor protein